MMKKIESTVFRILCEDKRARSDDYYLYHLFILEEYPEFDLSKTYVDCFLFNFYQLGLPPIDSVGRARRKIQAKHPELKDPETSRRRRLKEKKFIDYAKS